MAKRVVALGFFDGVHIGHGELLKKTDAIARRLGVSSAVLTYSQHPSQVLASLPVALINTTEERCALISELYKIDEIIIKDFTKEYASLSCERFFEDIIINELSAVHVVAGFDFRFGRGGIGDCRCLRALCEDHGIGCDIISAVMRDGEAVSSSKIRRLLADGDIEEANALLGHSHCIISEITHGRKLGAELGFPTVNQEIGESILAPKFGVYSSVVTVRGKKYRGVTNIGLRPTVAQGEPPRAETFILDFEGDLYGEKIRVELVSFLRPEMKFSSLDELKAQISRDTAAVRSATYPLF